MLAMENAVFGFLLGNAPWELGRTWIDHLRDEGSLRNEKYDDDDEQCTSFWQLEMKILEDETDISSIVRTGISRRPHGSIDPALRHTPKKAPQR